MFDKIKNYFSDDGKRGLHAQIARQTKELELYALPLQALQDKLDYIEESMKPLLARDMLLRQDLDEVATQMETLTSLKSTLSKDKKALETNIQAVQDAIHACKLALETEA